MISSFEPLFARAGEGSPLIFLHDRHLDFKSHLDFTDADRLDLLYDVSDADYRVSRERRSV